MNRFLSFVVVLWMEILCVGILILISTTASTPYVMWNGVSLVAFLVVFRYPHRISHNLSEHALLANSIFFKPLYGCFIGYLSLFISLRSVNG